MRAQPAMGRRSSKSVPGLGRLRSFVVPIFLLASVALAEQEVTVEPELDLERLDQLCPPEAGVLYCVQDDYSRRMTANRQRLNRARASEGASLMPRPVDGLGGVELEGSGGSVRLRWSLAAPKGEAIDIGRYENAERTAFRDGGLPGSDLAMNSRTCFRTATFEVLEMRFDEERNWLGVAADFYQLCAPNVPGYLGRVCWNCRPELFDRDYQPPLSLIVDEARVRVPLRAEHRHRLRVVNRGAEAVSGVRLVIQTHPRIAPLEDIPTTGVCRTDSIAHYDLETGRTPVNRILCELGTIEAGAEAEVSPSLQYAESGIFDSTVFLLADDTQALPRNNRFVMRAAVSESEQPAELLAISAGSGPSRLYRLDPGTGSASEIGNTGLADCSALAFGSKSRLYGICRRPDGELRALFDIDPETASSSEIGPLGFEISGEEIVTDLAVHDGRLVAMSLPQGLLWTIDAESGAARLVGTYRGTNRQSHGLASVAGQLYEMGEHGLESPVLAGWSQTISDRGYGSGVRALAASPGDVGGVFALVGLAEPTLVWVRLEDGESTEIGPTDPLLTAMAARPVAGALLVEPSEPLSGAAAGASKQQPSAPEPVVPEGPGTLVGTMTVTVDLAASRLRYRIVLDNRGGHEQRDNPGDELVLAPPTGARLVSSAAPMSGSLTRDVQTGSMAWNGSLAPGERLVFDVYGAIEKIEPGLEIVAQAQIHYDGDDDGRNESLALTDDPSRSGAADPTVWAVPSRWGLAAYALLGFLVPLALLAALVVFARRRF